MGPPTGVSLWQTAALSLFDCAKPQSHKWSLRIALELLSRTIYPFERGHHFGTAIDFVDASIAVQGLVVYEAACKLNDQVAAEIACAEL